MNDKLNKEGFINILGRSLTKEIQNQSKKTVIPITSISWEEILVNSITRSSSFIGRDLVWFRKNYPTKKPFVKKHEIRLYWDPNSHGNIDIGIITIEFELKISAKTCNIKDDKVKISAYRLTKADNNINKMVSLIKNKENEIDYYLICAKENKRDHINYNIFISNHLFNIEEYNWFETYNKNNKHSGWNTNEKHGFYFEIRKKMSNQLWIILDVKKANTLNFKKYLTIKSFYKDMGADRCLNYNI